ncbi:hypothetical protein [Nakamurella endophytica]|uniref:Uncharacterized protein n=1 Tax=Nakamurella endophytica TaxID=1748367 RepID=A0A917T9H5_9ACTN|nr:hypothetical protein [Nakamurella endophytica]GGM14296.1 hypothetical protein GCM10011594_37900 [Nakamurella endophytica]
MMNQEAFTAAHSDALREWARGLYPLEAATELLIRACGGRFAAPGNPWVHVEDSGRAWIDFDELSQAVTAGGPWSGGERRILALAASFGSDDGLLNDNLPGLDRDNLALVLAAATPAAATSTSPRRSCGTRATGPTATPRPSVPDRCTRGRGGPTEPDKPP